jgi:hypothetical protein
VAHHYNPSYLVGRGRKTVVRAAQAGASLRPYLKNKLKAKRLGVWLKW